jgi:hypothetical protein
VDDVGGLTSSSLKESTMIVCCAYLVSIQSQFTNALILLLCFASFSKPKDCNLGILTILILSQPAHSSHAEWASKQGDGVHHVMESSSGVEKLADFLLFCYAMAQGLGKNAGYIKIESDIKLGLKYDIQFQTRALLT